MKKTYIIPSLRMTQLDGKYDILNTGSPRIDGGPNMKHGKSITEENMSEFSMDAKGEQDWASGW